VNFPHGRTVYRQRPKQVWDPYANAYVLGDWDDPDELPIPGAFIAQSSTAALGNATRTQALESKSLFCAPDADIQKDDRIRDGADVYPVDGIPAADENPFTGWRPAREIPLTRSVG
jgi:hypothetical protein